MTLHFAYGSNMDRAAMARRCPGAVALGRTILDNHRFIITADGYASVQRAPGEQVHGVLWRLTPRDLAALNAYEGLDSGLYTRVMMPVRSDERRVSAMVYLGRSRREGKPKPGYMESVIDAARAAHLPLAYIQHLQRWSPSWRGARETETGDVA
jgi:cation transport regulator ChaC